MSQFSPSSPRRFGRVIEKVLHLPGTLSTPGVTPTGLISGRFNEAGDFPITVRVESGSEADTTSFTLKVVPPVLAVDSVVNELLEISQPLTDDELIYLDLQGNNNQQLDLGDFVEWMRTTGGVTTAEEIAELLRAAAARGEKGGGDRE